MTFAVRLKNKRISLRLTQKELAHKIGDFGNPVSRSCVMFWENPQLIKNLSGQNTLPHPMNLISLAKALDVSPTWLEPTFDERLMKYVPPNENQPKDDIFLKNSEINSTLDFHLIKNIPKLTLKEIEKWLFSKQSLIRKGANMTEAERISSYFQYEMDGDAMINARELEKSILPGEMVIVDPSSDPDTFKTGDIVMASIGNKVDVKDDYKIRTLSKDGADSYLMALNPQYEKIKIEFPTYIIGKIINTIRQK